MCERALQLFRVSIKLSLEYIKLHSIHTQLLFFVLRFKNVMFDITPGEEVGDFEIKAKFLGVEMEKVQLHFQVKFEFYHCVL